MATSFLSQQQPRPQMQMQMQVLNVHTPASSYSIVHSLQQETFYALVEKLAKKEGVNQTQILNTGGNTSANGWIKYEWNEGIWNLDDDSDYNIFVWRFTKSPDPTLHVRDPTLPLPPLSNSPTSPTAVTKGITYTNPHYYAYKPAPTHAGPSSSSTKSKMAKSKRSTRSAPNGTSRLGNGKSSKGGSYYDGEGDEREGKEEGWLAYKKEYERFHAENGVRTVIGQIGPVKGVRMLLKEGYRHVYISRVFAAKNGFIPKDAIPGHYGYGGIVHIGKFPITLPPKNTSTTHTIYLTEETHFDVVLGRSFIEKRGVTFDGIDQTNVVCRDTGERLEVEVVVLRDGRGSVVTVT